MAFINVRELRKSCEGRSVFHGVGLAVEEGEVIGNLGPNGAGKTTLVEIVGGLRSRGAVVVTVAGFEPGREPRTLREILGIELQEGGTPAGEDHGPGGAGSVSDVPPRRPEPPTTYSAASD